MNGFIYANKCTDKEPLLCCVEYVTIENQRQ